MNEADKQLWLEFRRIGLLWCVNRILHIWGWAIVFAFENNDLVAVYPQPVSYRGFNRDDEEKGFEALTEYMLVESPRLHKEVNAEE